MHRFFCFLSCFVGLAVSSSAYGNWPTPKDFINHLLGTSGLYATFKAAFEAVYNNKEAKSSDFKKLKLFGEESGALGTWEKFALKKYGKQLALKKYDHVLQGKCGFFSCMVDLKNVLNIENVDKAVEMRFKDIKEDVEKKFSQDCINNKVMPAVKKICRVLLSEDFARKLLTDSFVNEFLAPAKSANKSVEKLLNDSSYEFLPSVERASYSYCSVDFYPVFYSECDFSFRLQYVQPSSWVRLQFEVDFNVVKCCLEENGEVDIGSNFEIQGCRIFPKEACLSQGDLNTAKGKLDKGETFIMVEGVHMKAIRMIKNKNMGNKKSTEKPQTDQAHNTQPFSAAPNPFQTVNNVTEGTETEQKDSFQSEFPNTELYQEIWPGSKSQKKEQTGGKVEEQKMVQSGGGKKINKGNASQQQGQVSTKKRIKKEIRRIGRTNNLNDAWVAVHLKLFLIQCDFAGGDCFYNSIVLDCTVPTCSKISVDSGGKHKSNVYGWLSCGSDNALTSPRLPRF